MFLFVCLQNANNEENTQVLSSSGKIYYDFYENLFFLTFDLRGYVTDCAHIC